MGFRGFFLRRRYCSGTRARIQDHGSIPAVQKALRALDNCPRYVKGMSLDLSPGKRLHGRLSLLVRRHYDKTSTARRIVDSREYDGMRDGSVLRKESGELSLRQRKGYAKNVKIFPVIWGPPGRARNLRDCELQAVKRISRE